ncbi:MAG: hypothetical protein V9F00_16240 [Nocardioides sp.]
MKARRVPALAVVAMLLVVGGCSSAKDDDSTSAGSGQTSASSADSSAAATKSAKPGKKGTKKAGKNAPSPSPAPSDLPTDQETITTSDGGTVSTSGDLPVGFPKDVKLVDGKILSATTGIGADNVTVLHDAGLKATYTDALRLLTKAGFDIKQERTAPHTRMARLVKADMQVEVSLLEMGPNQTSLTYFVTST